MKNFIVILFTALLFTACESSDDSAPSFESDISVDGVQFVPTKATVAPATANMSGEAALNFTLSKGTVGSSNYEAIQFKINYPQTSSSAPNGVYDFGVGVIGEMLFTNGSYVIGDNVYSLAGYTVQVTALGDDEYRLDFQNIQAVNPFVEEEIKIISGYFEGKMN
jgi:hypothetical protein